MIQLEKLSTSEAIMEKQRYVKTDDQSFFRDYLYDQIVPEDHFLRKLKQLIGTGSPKN
jgi:hypothetical protein